jgi:putative SOS response-associated peptidase YedK
VCGRLNQYAQLRPLSIAGRELRIERRKKKEREDKRSAVPVVNNICPTDYADVFIMQAGEMSIERMRFGLIPQWAKGNKAAVWKKFMLTFNARCETVFDLASYRLPVRQQRCLIPVRGWHEWPDSKTPYYIHRADDEPLLLAGIWDVWESLDPADEDSGPVVTSMSVVTTPPGRYMAKFHDRSPLVLEGESALAWLQTGLIPPLSPSLCISDVLFVKLYNNHNLVIGGKSRHKTEEVMRAIAPPVPQAGDESVKMEEEISPQLKLF